VGDVDQDSVRSEDTYKYTKSYGEAANHGPPRSLRMRPFSKREEQKKAPKGRRRTDEEEEEKVPIPKKKKKLQPSPVS
jgi:hypothetical protein